MTDTIQFKRRINGAAGSPGTAGAKEGEIAFNAPGAAGGTTKPTLFFYDGTAWRTVNPDVTVTTQSITLAGSADIGAAYTAWAATPGNTITGNVVIASYTPTGGTAAAYILTNMAAPGVAASWTNLGGSTVFASNAEIATGTEAAKAVSPLGLRGATVITSAGAAQANFIPRLDATGKLDPSVLPANATHLAGAIDPTAVPPTGVTTGAMYFANKDGTINAGFTGITAGTAIKTSDALIYDGTNWHHIPNGTDLSAYVPLAGTNLMTGNIVWSGAAGNKAGTTIFDGKGGTIDNVLLDCGTY